MNSDRITMTAEEGRRFVLRTAVPLAGSLAAVLAFNLAVDPYQLRPDNAAAWRAGPTSERTVKSLQVIARDPEVVFLGSSRTLLGIDAAHAGMPAYNLGLSGLTARELEILARHTLRWTDARTLVVGVDDFMFRGKAGHDGGLPDDLDAPGKLVESLGTSLLSLDAVRDAGRSMGYKTSRGRMRGDGFMVYPPKHFGQIDRELAQYVRWRPSRLSDAQFGHLERLLAACEDRGVRAIVYISPIHHRLYERTIERDGPEEYARFRTRVAEVAARHGAAFADFAPPNDVTSVPLVDANDYYGDASHFTARVGDLVLHRLGFPAAVPAEDRPLLAGFGTPRATHIAEGTTDGRLR